MKADIQLGQLVVIKQPYFNSSIWGCKAKIIEIPGGGGKDCYVSIIGFNPKKHRHTGKGNKYNIYLDGHEAELFHSVNYFLSKLKGA